MYCLLHDTNHYCVFISVALYAITASYFAGVMVRLILTLAPVVCILSAIAFSECFSYCLIQDKEDNKPSKKKFLNHGDAVNADSNSESDESESSTEKKSKKNLYDKVKCIR